MSKRKTLNSVYNTHGDATSGQFVLDGSADNASTFVSRFYAEVSPKQGNGFDSYLNGHGPARSDTLTLIDASGNAKLALLAIDALHQKVAEGDKDAETALASIVAYNTVAAEKTANRKKMTAVDAAIKAAREAGIAEDKIKAMFGLADDEPNITLTPVRHDDNEPTVEPAGEVVESEDANVDGIPSTEEVVTA